MTEFWYIKKKSHKFNLALACSENLSEELGTKPERGYYRLISVSKKEAKQLLRWLKTEYGPVDVHKGEMPPETNTVHQGDCLDRLKDLPNNCVDLICTDPPYGLTSVDPKRSSNSSDGDSTGFMGAKWDAAVPSVTVWQECLRVLKPGAFAFILCTPRQDCLAQMILNLKEAGFVTGYSFLTWIYASGFPKSQNLSKAVDKRAGVERPVVGTSSVPNQKKGGYTGKRYKEKRRTKFGVVQDQPNATVAVTEEAKKLEGAYAGAQFKPALEPILVVMKPLDEKTYLDQALANGKGCTHLDDCRIPTDWGNEYPPSWFTSGKGRAFTGPSKQGPGLPKGSTTVGDRIKISPAGRFPANVLVSDDVLNDGMIRTSGKMKAGVRRKNRKGYTGPMPKMTGGRTVGDSGSFSRFFDLDVWFAHRIGLLPEAVQKVFPNLIVPKASKREKNAGLDGMVKKISDPTALHRGRRMSKPSRIDGKAPTIAENHHPTVKPVKLFSYLVTLGSREGDIILDPYMGSGTTGVATIILKRRFIGIELDLDYVEIAVKRIKYAMKQYKKAMKKLF